MRITITGKKIDIGAALRGHVERKILDAVEKFGVRPTEAKVTVSREGVFFVCDCLAHLSTGMTAQASYRDDDAYAACDLAIARLEKQLRRYKRRLKDHHSHRKEPIAQRKAAAYVLSTAADTDPNTDLAERAGDAATRDQSSPAQRPLEARGDLSTQQASALSGATTAAAPAGSVGETAGGQSGPESAFWRPTIVAEEVAAIPALTVGEAVMQMELSGADYLLFFNDANGRLNAVHMRTDGNVGWIDPIAE